MTLLLLEESGFHMWSLDYYLIMFDEMAGIASRIMYTGTRTILKKEKRQSDCRLNIGGGVSRTN